MENRNEEMSLYWAISAMLPITAAAFAWRFVGGWLALTLWLSGAAVYYAWRRPWYPGRAPYVNLIYAIAVVVYGPIFAVSEVLKKLFPKLATL